MAHGQNKFMVHSTEREWVHRECILKCSLLALAVGSAEGKISETLINLRQFFSQDYLKNEFSLMQIFF